jgi:hypothetical protein
MSRRGNCYATCEALYHLLGGKEAGWKPMRLKMKPSDQESHWFLKHSSGVILDPTKKQFGGITPNYAKGVGSGFLTKKPSWRARQLMDIMVWQEA